MRFNLRHDEKTTRHRGPAFGYRRGGLDAVARVRILTDGLDNNRLELTPGKRWTEKPQPVVPSPNRTATF